MNPLAILFFVVGAVYIWKLPRRKAFIPLLATASFMTGAEIEIGPAHFTVLRLVLLVGVLRINARREKPTFGWQWADKLMLAWGMALVGTSIFHEEFGSTVVYRLGLAFDHLAMYFLLRVFIDGFDSIKRISRIILIFLIPLAALMLIEKFTGRNCFGFLGGVPEISALRHGKVRAQGCFAHAILAGTVGAACFPLALLFWKTERRVAVMGAIAALGIVYASGSSGPIMTTLTIIMALFIWKIRWQMKTIRWGAISMIILLSLVMQDPVYYLIARIDITGGSTGWHRAELIHAAITHIDEWWLGGTDYTRHWMPTGVEWNAKHTDITNHYIKMGVWGGLLMVILFISVLVVSFVSIGKILRPKGRLTQDERILTWVLGCILFGHATTFISVSYYDQSLLYYYFVLASICTARAMLLKQKPVPAVPVSEGKQPDPAGAACV